MKSFEQMEVYVSKRAEETEKKRAVLVASEDREGLIAIKAVYERGLIEPILIGNIEKTKEICLDLNFDISNIETINKSSSIEACKEGVRICKSNQGDILIKGQIKTADFFRPIINRENGIKVSSVMSTITVAKLDILDRMVVISDAGMLIKPSLKEKAAMIENASICSRKLVGRKPKAAVVCAVEVVNEAMPDTIDAALLAKMSDRGQIRGAIVDGPLAMDNAISSKAASIKGIKSDVAGDVDILIVPNIEVGNVLVKSLNYIAKVDNASYIHGAQVPILAQSRADGAKEKYNSILLAIYMSEKEA